MIGGLARRGLSKERARYRIFLKNNRAGLI